MIEGFRDKQASAAIRSSLIRSTVGRPLTPTLKMTEARADGAPSLAFGYLGIRACAMA
jgi:hypothetical protein